MSLAIREFKYQVNAAFCHFGREPYTWDGIEFFEWENASGLLKQELVQLPCSIGVAKPLSLVVERYDAERGALRAEDITNAIESRSTAARAPLPCRWRSANPSTR